MEARAQLRDSPHTRRLLALLRDPLASAQSAGLIDPELRVEDLALAQRMAYGVIVTDSDPAAARRSVQRALALIDPALSWSDPT
ncbi:hypothetical protein [Egibacter rhizosphaerae]|uniref:hypothetical protein n=1 Tax=Egibacter rhizosphaerae TaxID=1670831 RepID=UPI00197A73E1|nr:hypothetical protein [Egibacter rhizosphaerae]